MSAKCNYCINKERCNECDKKGWLEQFIPSEEVRIYFKSRYNGVRGYDGKSTWDFETTNPDLVETHSIEINGDYYCPYCGENMFPIQANTIKYNDYNTSGYCCICEGARAEIEYEKEKKELEEKYENEQNMLNGKFINKLAFNTDRLFETKQRIEKNRYERFKDNKSYLSTLNGNRYETIEQILR